MENRIADAKTFSCDPNFCVTCGAILPLPDQSDVIPCKCCGTLIDVKKMEGIKIYSFKNYNQDKLKTAEELERIKNISTASTNHGPIVKRQCPKCPHKKMTYTTRQTSTIFHECYGYDMDWRILIAICFVFIGCGLNVVFLEFLIKYSPGCGDLVTFCQFLFTATYGFITEFQGGRKKAIVPIKEYMVAVVLYFISSLTGNLAFSCNIAMPIQMIFKSGSVMASMALGVILLGKRYSLSKYASVAMITIGISTCLLVSAKPQAKGMDENDTFMLLCGIALLSISLLCGARLGIAQEQIVNKYGKHPKEMMFYIHALSLPFFALFAKNIYKQAATFTQSEMIESGYLPFALPLVWIYLALNLLTQFVCVRSVTTLTSELSALAITVILTLRKFMSLIVSILYFRNPFTLYHWFGSILVFSGTLLFTEVPQKLCKALHGEKSEKEVLKKKE